MNDNSAAKHLVGLTLDDQWVIKKKLERGDNDTGSFFSVGYIAEKNGKEYFLKAFNLGRFFSMSASSSVMDAIHEMTEAYRYERDLSEHCKNKHVTKVAFVQGYGEAQISGFIYGTVPYLIFQLANGDVRNALESSENLDYAWRFKSLHDIAIGLKQLHKVKVSHQDLKPSNILLYDKESKLGDLGRSVCEDIHSAYSNMSFTGDLTYAPPEIMYRNNNSNKYALDCYMLGSLTVFYFTGVTMNGLLLQHIAHEHKPDKWMGGDYSSIEPYIINAFEEALEDFLDNIKKESYRDELLFLVKNLCNPIVHKRGHPKNILSNSKNNYNLERFISKLDLLRHKAEISTRGFQNG